MSSAHVVEGSSRTRGRRTRLCAALGLAGLMAGSVLSPPSAAAANADDVVDRYGQKTSTDWPGKVTSDEQLVADIADEREWMDTLTPPERSAWGGEVEAEFGATGWFRIEERDGRSILVDPSGSQFFSLGINGLGGTSDTTTQVRGREEIYEWLPDRGTPSAYDAGWRDGTKDHYSFYVANQVRKYGEFDRTAWHARQLERVNSWGFNTAGGFSQRFEGTEPLPYVQLLDRSPSDRIGTSGIPDIYKAGYAEQLDANFASEIAQYRDDPYLIGYTFFNEINWSAMRTAVTRADGATVASKAVLVAQLEASYGSIEAFNAAWNMTAADWTALQGLSFSPTTDAAVADLDAFATRYFEDFYRMYADTVRAHDPNHLVLGDRWLANVINDDKIRGQLATAAGRHLDALAYNYYTWDLSLERIGDIYEKSGGKPVLITEFHYGEPTRDLTFAIRMAENEEDKGLLYRSFVEKAAASGMVIGTHWFLHLDQAATGRWFQGFDGEAGAIGLIDVTDRPYRAALSNMMAANYDIYDIMNGRKEPYRYPYKPGQTEREGDNKTDIPHTDIAPAVDGTLDEKWPEGPTLTLGPADLVLGVSEEGVGADFRLAWDAQNLYVHASIDDPTPMTNPHNGSLIWNGDAIELFVGPENVDQGGSIQVRDSQLVISGKPLDDTGDTQAYWYNNRAEQVPVDAVVVAAEGGYQLEAAIPMDALGLAGTPAPREIRFDIGLDDGVGASRQRQYLWNGVDGNASNREKWGRATLVGAAPDTVRPETEMVAPTTFVSRGTLDVQIDATDDTALSRIVANIYREGQLVRSTQTRTDAAQGSHRATVQLEAGSYTIRYNAHDAAGNVSETREQSFTVDRTRPEITLLSPTADAVSEGGVDISATASDAHGIDRIVANVYQNGALVRSTSSRGHSATSAEHTANVELAAGVYTLRYNAHDVAGNVSTTRMVSFTVE